MIDMARISEIINQLGIHFVKASPTTYVLHHRQGKLLREGAGLSFLYFAPTSTLSLVPVGSIDVPFAFSQVSSDFQAMTVQGQVTFRVADPKRLAELLDFSTTPAGAYTSDDPQKLKDRVVAAVQVLTQTVTGRLQLHEALVNSESLVSQVLESLKASETITMLGLEILALSVLAVRPTPEMSKALEADAREALLRRADQAIYARRNAAVEQERTIKENELKTDIAVEQKRRQIRETKIAADIAIETERSALIDKKSENDRKESDTAAYGLEVVMRHVRDVDWKVLTSMTAAGSDPRIMIATAFREMAQNAEKVGELHVSPDLLNSLLGPQGK